MCGPVREINRTNWPEIALWRWSGGLDDAGGEAYLAQTMSKLPLRCSFSATWVGTWLARRQERLIGYLKEASRVLLEKQ